jgi:protein TonB
MDAIPARALPRLRPAGRSRASPGARKRVVEVAALLQAESGPPSLGEPAGRGALWRALLFSAACHAAAAVLLTSGSPPEPGSRERPIAIALLRVPAEPAPGAIAPPPPAPPARTATPPRRATPPKRAAALAAPGSAAEAAPPPPSSEPVAAAAAPAVAAAAPAPGAPGLGLRGLHQGRPHYPRAARLRGSEGTTLLRVHVEPDGRVVAVEVARSAGDLDLDRAAARAVRRWRFEPLGSPSSLWVLVPVEFHLR